MILKRILNILRIRKSILRQKKVRVASVSGGHTQTNIDLLKVLKFVKKTKQTLSNYSELLQTHLYINLAHQEMS